MSKVWQVKPGGKQVLNSVEETKTLMFKQRGVGKGQAATFLEANYHEMIYDPYLLSDMKVAVDKIYEAINKGQQILVYGDYDVDGVSSTAIMVDVLRDLRASVVPFLPHRIDNGYGLDQKALQQIVDQFDLMITVDCGVSNAVEIDWLNKKGKDVIVTDHHSLPAELPAAVAIVHPANPNGNYPFAGLCGAAVSWKLAAGLLRDKRCKLSNKEAREQSFLDLCCLGTIADMVPLVDENRAIVKYGLKLLESTNRVGVRMLVRSVINEGEDLEADQVAFRIGPLINAAGRMDHAQPALDLLLTDDERGAAKYLELLKQLNNERRRVARQVQLEAERMSMEGATNILIAMNEQWPVGVLGLAAGRLSDKYGMPAVVIGGTGSQMVGSVRGPEGVDVLAMLKGVREKIVKFGGHTKAAGFSVAADQVEPFVEALQKQAASSLSKRKEVVVKRADLIINEDLVGWEMIEMVEKMKPFGQGNERPVFIYQNIYVGDWRGVGKMGEHAKLALRINDDLVGGIGFGLVEQLERDGIPRQGMVDILGTLEINNYNGRRSLQIRVEDVVKAGEVKITEMVERQNVTQ